MRHGYTDTSPNNNGVVTAESTAAQNYSPTYNAVGFAFDPTYLTSTNNASVAFSNVQLTYTAATDAAAQSITFAPLADRAFDPAPVALSATASSGLPVVFSVVSGPATLSGNNALTLTGVGTVTVRASQPGNYTTLPAVPVERTFEVSKGSATVSLSALEAVYDGSAKEVIATTTPPGLPVDITYNGSASAPSSIGTYSVVATINDPNYDGSASALLDIVAPRFTWTNPATGADLAWSSSANWASAQPPTAIPLKTIAFFTGQNLPAGTITTVQDVSTPLDFHLLELNGTGPVSGNATVRLSGQLLRPVQDNENRPAIELNAGPGVVYDLAGGLTLDAPLDIVGSGGGTLTVSGPIGGGGDLVFAATSQVTLSASNPYTGSTRVAAGTLRVSGSLTGTSSVAVDSGATLVNTGLIIAPQVIVADGGTLAGTGTFQGNLSIAGTASISGPGTLRVEGNLINTGTLRLTGGARLEVTGTVTNQGVLDLIMGDPTLPGSIVNTGTVLDAGTMRVAPPFTLDQTGAHLDVQTFEGHRFQLQRSDTLQAGSWINIGDPVPGTGGRMMFTDPNPGSSPSRGFYRIIIVP